MRVTVTFLGPLADYTGQRTAQIELTDEAVYGEMLDEIGRRYGGRFPKPIWDVDQCTFKRGILVIGSGRDLDSRETSLMDGEEIKVVPIVGGG